MPNKVGGVVTLVIGLMSIVLMSCSTCYTKTKFNLYHNLLVSTAVVTFLLLT